MVVGERHGGVAAWYYIWTRARRGEEWEWNGFVAWARWRGRSGRRRRLLFDEASRPGGRTNAAAVKIATLIPSCLPASDESVPMSNNNNEIDSRHCIRTSYTSLSNAAGSSSFKRDGHYIPFVLAKLTLHKS